MTRLTRFQTFEKPVLLAKELGNEEDRDSATQAVPDDHDLSARLASLCKSFSSGRSSRTPWTPSGRCIRRPGRLRKGRGHSGYRRS